MRDKVGSFRSRESMQDWLNEWILKYVDGDPLNSSEETKARRPLAAAQVEVEEVEGQPGYYQSQVLPQAALPARRPDGVFAAGVQAAVREGVQLILRTCAAARSETAKGE